MQTREVLVYVYDSILKLAHPFMPFITEELWQALPHAGEALIVAPWPAGGLPVDSQATAHFEALQAAVRAVRNARAEYGVEPGRKIAATVATASPELREALAREAPVMALLGRLDPEQLQFESQDAARVQSTSGQIELVVADGLEVRLPMAGLFDASKEIDRLEKQAAKIQKELEGLQARLSNKKFMDKAPQKVVDEVQGAAAEAAEQLAAIREKVAKFAALA